MSDTLPIADPLVAMQSTAGATAARDVSEFSTYAYSYPHKSSYQRLSPPVPIGAAWQDEGVNALSLYVHIPFCEMRCGFCNLFTQSQPAVDVVKAYLATLIRQMRVVRAEVSRARFGQLAVGGGTPTFLAASELEELFHQLETTFGQTVREWMASVEVSPPTATADRLNVLAGFGVERISIGVQSFLTSETQQIGRPQQTVDVYEALERIRSCNFPALNIDLIYGDPRQTRQSWLASLREALRYKPEELYLYPLYIRPETGLARGGRDSVDQRMDLYAAARDLLGEQGYEQASLRCFRLPGNKAPTSYGCQRDGMIGLGCGARSYTQRLHYSSRFATTQAGIRAILDQWVAQTDEELALATHGIWLSEEEQRRRFIILSLLQTEGLASSEFRERFPTATIEEVVDVVDLIDRGWLAQSVDRYVLTADGIAQSDALAPLLYSEAVRDRLRRFIALAPISVGGTT
jgi:oxygen-independent coproporphyrinogen III oxidase